MGILCGGFRFAELAAKLGSQRSTPLAVNLGAMSQKWFPDRVPSPTTSNANAEPAYFQAIAACSRAMTIRPITGTVKDKFPVNRDPSVPPDRCKTHCAEVVNFAIAPR